MKLPPAATDCGTHRPAQHRMDAGIAMLHFAGNPDQRALATAGGGAIEQPYQLWHQPLAVVGYVSLIGFSPSRSGTMLDPLLLGGRGCRR